MRGVGGKTPDSALEKEIDASLSALDALDALDNGPTGTSLPDDTTGATNVRESLAPSTQDAAGHIPRTVREGGPSERPRMTTDPSITTTSDSAMPAPMTLRGEADIDDSTGVSMVGHDMLESTNARPQDEEEIVIADDLAEIVDDGSNKDLGDVEENTDAGTGTVPPYRSDG